MVKISISIISYNTKDITRECLRSVIKASSGLSREILVVDNYSTDGSYEMIIEEFPEVDLICNNENKFFTGGHNQNLKRAKGEYILILNSDLFLSKETVLGMIDYISKNEHIAGVAPKTILLNGSVEKTIKRKYSFWELMFTFTFLSKLFTPRREVARSFEYEIEKISEPIPVEIVQDSCILIKKRVIEEIGFYDEHFKLYFTEDDICIRMREKGYKIYFLPNLVVKHLCAQSTKKEKKIIINEIYQRDLLEYVKKYHSKIEFLLMKFISRMHLIFLRIFYFLTGQVNK